jgi:phage-related protein
LDQKDVEYIIQVVNEYYDPESFSLDYIPEQMFNWEIGGLADPIGQLTSWLWSQIQGALTFIRGALEGFISSAISGLQSFINSAISGLRSALEAPLNWVRANLSTVLSVISGIQSFLSSIFSGITSAITHIGATLAGIVSAIQTAFQSIISTIVSRIEYAFGSIRAFIDGVVSRITDIITRVSGFISQVQNVLSGFAHTISMGLSQFYTGLQSFARMIVDGVVALKDWLINAFKNVGGVLAQVGTAIQSFFNQVYNALKQFYTYVSEAIKGIPTAIANWWSGVEKFFSDVWNRLASGVKEVQTTLMGFINPLIQIGNWLTTAFWQGIQGAINFFTKDLPKWLGDFWKWLMDVKDLIWNFFTKDLPKWVGDFWKWLMDVKDAIWDFFTKSVPEFFGKHIPNFFKWLGDFKDMLWNFFTKTIPEFFTKTVPRFFTQDIPNFFKDMFGRLWEWIEPHVTAFKEKIVWFAQAIWSGLQTLGSWIVQGLSNLGKAIMELGINLFQMIGSIFHTITGAIWNRLTGIAEGAKNVIGSIVVPVFEAIGGGISGYFKGLGDRILKGETKGEFVELGLITSTIFLSQFVFRWSANIFWWLGELFKDVEISLDVFLRPWGVGYKGGSVFRMSAGYIFKHISQELQKYPDTYAKAMIYGLSIWISQPYARLLSSITRDILPMNLPPLSEIVEMVRRSYGTDEFEKFLGHAQRWLSLYGYSTNMINAYLSPPRIEEAKKALTFAGMPYAPTPPSPMAIEITDRFGKPRTVPRALVFDLPSSSELSRMMVKDIFQSLDDFTKIMQIRGYHPDLTYMYYLLHYRYPPPEKLWEFYCRAKANMLWYSPVIAEIPEVSKGIGFTPVTPKDLNLKENVIKMAIETYMKWHDYAPFSWIQGFTSDRQLMLDLMADIPMRIDARWMYKWQVPTPTGVFDDKELQRIVIARGLHPDWVDSVTIAEAMNALTEERSYARTGILNAYEAGYLTKDLADKILSNMVTIRLLDKDVPVKMIEGERKLLLLRSDYDRAYKVIDKAWDSLTMGMYENVYTKSEVLSNISKVVSNINTILGLNLVVDEKYLDAWLEAFGYRKEVWTISRIRYWLRTFIWRVGDLAQSGADVDKIIEDYAKKAHLTDEEKELIKEIAYMFKDGYLRDLKISGIIAKLRRGAMTIDEAKSQLSKFIKDPDLIEALIESKAKTKTVSTDKLISMMEYIPIDPQKLKQKMEIEGVPPDEQALYIPYAVASEISEEVGRVATELINDYVDGVISLDDLQKGLDELATLGGNVKSWFGVDWIVLSPTERKILIYLAELRRRKKLAKARK